LYVELNDPKMMQEEFCISLQQILFYEWMVSLRGPETIGYFGVCFRGGCLLGIAYRRIRKEGIL